MIKITQDELLAFNVQNNTVTNAQAELQRSVQARNAFIGLLEVKYSAVFNPTTSTLEPKPEGKKTVATK